MWPSHCKKCWSPSVVHADYWRDLRSSTKVHERNRSSCAHPEIKSGSECKGADEQLSWLSARECLTVRDAASELLNIGLNERFEHLPLA